MLILKMTASLLVAATAMTPTAAHSVAPASALESALRTQASNILNRSYPENGPGAAAIIMHRGKLVYAEGRGLADIANQRAISVDTPFRLASITKQFTAATVLKLVAAGRLSLDDPIAKFFPEWPNPQSQATVRQLLNHTSGLQDFTKIPGWMANKGLQPHTTDQLVEVMKNLPPKAEPGEKWEYNNGGYVLLGAILERVTGKPWYEVVRQEIAWPLGLTSIDYAVTAKQVANRYSGGDTDPVPASGAHMSVAGAAGGLVGSVRDLAKWAEALHHGKVLPAALYREMVQPARLSSGKAIPYGFGLHLKRFLGERVLDHGGAGRGIDTASAYFPDEELFVAVLANTNDATQDASVVVRHLAAVSLGRPIPLFTPAKVDAADAEPLFGVYSAGTKPDLHFFGRNGRFFLAAGDDELPLRAAGADRFYAAPNGLTWLEFVRAKDGKITLRLHDQERLAPEEFRRLGPVPAQASVALPEDKLQSFAGSYETERGPVRIVVENGSLTLQPPRGEPILLHAVSPTEFATDGNQIRLVFDIEGTQASGFTLHRGARELHGKRTASDK